MFFEYTHKGLPPLGQELAWPSDFKSGGKWVVWGLTGVVHNKRLCKLPMVRHPWDTATCHVSMPVTLSTDKAWVKLCFEVFADSGRRPSWQVSLYHQFSFSMSAHRAPSTTALVLTTQASGQNGPQQAG